LTTYVWHSQTRTWTNTSTGEKEYSLYGGNPSGFDRSTDILIAYGETRSKKYDVTFVYHDSMNAFLKTSEAQRAKDLAKNYQNGGK